MSDAIKVLNYDHSDPDKMRLSVTSRLPWRW